MTEFFQAFALIFLAEMGDKSQLLALAFASTYSLGLVIVGVSLGIALNHALALALAYLLASSLGNMSLLHLFAALLFIFFGFKSFQEEEEEEEEAHARPSSLGPVITVAASFFLAELGDKTQLTAMTLALESSRPLLIYAATVSSMISVSLIGIGVGRLLGKTIPERAMSFLAGLLFLYFGYSKLRPLLPLDLSAPLYWGLALVISLPIIAWIIKSSGPKEDPERS